VPTTKVLESAEEAYSIALKEAGVSMEEIQALGTTGYGRSPCRQPFKSPAYPGRNNRQFKRSRLSC
jgi:activator of 2-hydroxyglutaryl-CoA dehydratase